MPPAAVNGCAGSPRLLFSLLLPRLPRRLWMSLEQDRRLFLKAGATLFAASALASERAAQRASAADSTPPSETVRVAMMGVNTRGQALTKSFLAAKGAEIVAICDVDARAADKAAELVAKGQSRPATVVKDIRQLLDDASTGLLIVATPNHSHAPSTCLGCAADKHVYVENP